jgi:hypothetical protein
MILALEDARQVLKKIEPPVEREIIWTRRMDADDQAPTGMVLLGYDASVFYLPIFVASRANSLTHGFSRRR